MTTSRDNEMFAEAASWAGAFGTGIGVVLFALFPFALPILLLTLAFAAPLLILALPLGLVAGVALGIRGIARRLRSGRGAQQDSVLVHRPPAASRRPATSRRLSGSRRLAGSQRLSG